MIDLKTWRIEKELSAKEAGELVGVSAVQWLRYETGERYIGPKRIATVAAVTGISQEKLRPDLAHIFTTTQDMGSAQ